MSSLFLSKKITHKESISDRFIAWLNGYYTPFLARMLRHRIKIVTASLVLLAGAVLLFNSLGGEFIPELDEGDFATNYTIRQGSNLKQTIETGTRLEKLLLQNFPEVKECVSKIGTSEVPTDPMPIESADLIIVLKDKKEWTTAHDKEELAEKMNKVMSVIPGMNLSFEQPIQMRFNELIAGVKSDIAIKIFGENLDVLFDNGNKTAKIISGIEGLSDIKVEQVIGMPQLVVHYDRERIAQYGVNIEDVNTILNTALAGGKAGVVYEGEKKFDLVVRLANYRDADEEKVKNIFVPLPNGTQVPMSQLADVTFRSAPAQISREDAERRIVVEANVRGRDIQSVVEEIQRKLDTELKLPSGYYFTYGGTFQNLQQAKQRLQIAVPVALLLIFLLLFFSFRSLTESFIIFSAIPMAAIGGVVSLWMRGMNFSISAGVGFIALFGVAVLNGIVLIAYLNRLRDEGEEDITQRILKGTAARLRPVLATAAVASLGFLPMALSTSAGSEVQKPLATVVIGGLISSTLLTLIVLPVLYSLFIGKNQIKINGAALSLLIPLFIFGNTQQATAQNANGISLDSAIAVALRSHPLMQSGAYAVQQEQQLKKTSFTLDPLSVTYTGGQINSSAIDYNINATTGIKFPTEIAAQNNFQNAQIAVALSRLNVTKAELIKNVSIAYVQLQAGIQQLSLLDSLAIIYDDFARFANAKFTAGETTLLEKVSAESQLKTIQLKRSEAEANLSIYQSNLQQWLGTSQPVAVLPVQDFRLPVPRESDTSLLRSSPLFQLQQEQLNASMAGYKLEKSKYAPSLQFGYFNQSLDKLKNFNGFSVGASIPFIKTGQQGRKKSAELGIKISSMELANYQLKLQTAYTEAWQEFNKYSLGLNYYTTEGLNLASTLISVADKSYQRGEIGYTEFILHINNAFDIRSNYLQTLSSYNQSIIHLNYLISQ